jgi:hypothetical protein
MITFYCTSMLRQMFQQRQEPKHPCTTTTPMTTVSKSEQLWNASKEGRLDDVRELVTKGGVNVSVIEFATLLFNISVAQPLLW